MLRRPALLASLAVIAIGGCAASRNDRNPFQVNATPLGDKPSAAIADVVAAHNQNATLVDHMQATAAVSTQSRLLSGAGSGILEFERPRNFRFQVEAGFRKQVDIGSNDDEFWFWGSDKKNPTIYKCHYDSLAESAEQPPFQPEWIVESLGLYEIPESEMRQIRIARNVKPGVDQWTHTRPFGQSNTLKITLVDQQTGRFIEHRFFTPSSRNPLAVVTPSDFREIKRPDGSSAILPQRLHLRIQAEEPKQPIELELALSGTTINKPITPAQRSARFEPKAPDISPNAQVYYLDEHATQKARGDRADKSQKRQSLAQPPLKGTAPAELGEPSPFDRADDSSLRRSDPMPREATELPQLPDGASGVIGPQVPQPPERRVPQMAGRPSGMD